MDLSDFQRKAVILIFLSILVGSILLARKEPLKNQTQMLQEKKTNTVTKQIAQPQTKIDINTADMETLMQLPGIGPKYANEMINYRNTHGPFKYKEDLLNIPGIGENRFERIKDMIALPDKATATGSPDNISSRIQTSENKTQIISPDNKIDLNSATLEQLIYIPDIGPKTAKSIMDYRDTNGKFNNLEELKKISKIGDKTYEKLEQYLYVDSNTHKGIPNNILSNANIQPKIVYDSRIDPDVKCPYCGRQLWEKGKKKMVYLRCPYCLKILS